MRVTAILIVAACLVLGGSRARGDDSARKQDPRAAFAETDTNKDGFLEAEELKQLAFPDDFTDDDKDRDGRVSMREFLRVRFHDYDVADTDHDGVLSLDEVIAAFEGRKRR